MKNLAHNKTLLVKQLITVLGLFMLSFGMNAQQLPECEAGVPFFIIDLSSTPDSMYVTPEIVRDNQCCGDVDNQNYVSFYVTLHPDVAQISIGILPGYADPGGSGFYNIISGGDLITPGSCDTNIAGGEAVCITGSGPHKITYHKPGSNKVKYFLEQIPKPIYPQDDTTRVGCSLPLHIFGLDSIRITSINSSTGNTIPGAFDSLLSCTSCNSPSFSPVLGTPEWIDYQICGSPIAFSCGIFQTCDTVRLYTLDQLELSVTPNPAEFCSSESVILTASASGGDNNYNYIWINSIGDTVSTTSTFEASAQGTYTVEVADGLVTSKCHPTFVSVPVTLTIPPNVDVGPDITVCASDPEAFLVGTIEDDDDDGGIKWIGGAGTFNPSNTSLITTYTPTAAEIANGSVTLVLIATDDDGDEDCWDDIEDGASITIFFSDTVVVSPTFVPLICNDNTTIIDANASGGTAPLTYSWSTGESTSMISASAGTYSVTVVDSVGCSTTAPITITEPSLITLAMSSTNTSTDIACDGTATVAITGGVAPYSVVWSNGETTLTASNLCYGIVTVDITDANGCTSTGSVVVNNPSCSAFNVTATHTDVLCYGDSNAQAFSVPSGGTAPYTFAWNTSPVQNTQNAINLGAGTYTVTVVDSLGCIDVASVTVVQPTIITNTMTHIDASSIGGDDGSATANPAGGTPGYTYLWSPTSQNTQTAINLFAGTYYVNIVDANSCLKVDSVQINQPPCNNFTLGVNTQDVSCNGLSNGSAYVVIAQGTPPYSISWSSGENDVTSVIGLNAGSYTVSVTDASNCTTFASFDITQPDPLTIGVVPTNISCNNSGDGTIDLTVSGGTFPYFYDWTFETNQIATHEDLVNLTPGTYAIEVTDNNGCTVQGSTGISQPDLLAASFTSEDILCNGDGNGSIDATLNGGTLPYTYSWTGPSAFASSTEDISGLEFGLYELEVTDANGCTLNNTLQSFINEPDSVIIHAYTISCPIPGESATNVTIDSITGGSGGIYQISFDGGKTYLDPGVYTTSLTIDNTYTILALDSNGCNTPATTIITIDPQVKITDISFNPCIAPGTTAINITALPTGGDGGPYEVSTDGGSTFNSPGIYTFLLPVNNSYNVVLRDEKGCESTTSPIVIPAPFDATALLTAEVSCPGLSDGSIDLTVIGGTSPYTFAWTGPGAFSSASEDIAGLIDGTYDVTITDDNGCVINRSIDVTTIPDITPPEILSCRSGSQSVLSDIGNCTYVNSGIAWDASASDNCLLSSLVYNLTGATTGTGTSLNGIAFNLGTTTVTWTATDGSGNIATCTFDVVVTDDQLPEISSCGATETQNVFTDPIVCTYTHIGSSWDATSSDNCTISTILYTLTVATSGTGTSLDGAVFNLGTTTVTWTVTDGSGNISTCTFEVLVRDNEAPSIADCISDISVNNDINACGAVVNWIPPSFNDNCGATITSTHNPGEFFPIGTTTVTYTVVDGSGNASVCIFNITVTDNELPQIACQADIESCDSLVFFNSPIPFDNCGIVSITQTTGLSSGSIFPVGTTTITFEVLDVNGNINTCSFDVIIHPTPILTTTINDVSCFSFGDGSIDLTVTNGTAPYTYTWSNSATSEDISSLQPGTYGVTVDDFYGCSASIKATISEPDQLYLTKEVSQVSCYEGNDGAIDITVNGGILPYTYVWSNNATSEDIANVNAGIYTVKITDSNGCTLSDTTTIKEPTVLEIEAAILDATCDAANGSIQVQVTGGTTPYDYLWSDASTNINLTNVTGGKYTLTVTDDNGCIAVFTGAVGTTSNIFATTHVIDVTCHGEETGSALTIVESGNAPYIYNWSTGDTTEAITDLIAGGYSVTISDVFGCSTTLTLEIIQPDSLHIELYGPVNSDGFHISTYGGSDGSIEATISGGVEPYTYFWFPSESPFENLDNAPAGNYFLTVTDSNACAVTANLRLTEPNMLEMPEGVSPNDDGDNDYFVIHGLEAYPNNDITIYNRWGNIVFVQNGYDNLWNGVNRYGEPLPDGTYFVVLKVPPFDTLTGYIDLRRN